MNELNLTPQALAACCEIVTLANTVDGVAANAMCTPSRGENEIRLIQYAAKRIGLLADFLTDYGCCGVEHWLGLPEIPAATDGQEGRRSE